MDMSSFAYRFGTLSLSLRLSGNNLTLHSRCDLVVSTGGASYFDFLVETNKKGQQ